jgi:hypothetical protein
MRFMETYGVKEIDGYSSNVLERVAVPLPRADWSPSSR